MTLINKARGEVSVRLGERDYTLCLTLGALAAMESGLGLDHLEQIGARLEKPSMNDVIVILTALLRGGGHDVTDTEVRNQVADFSAVMTAIGRAFQAAGLGGDEAAPPPGKPSA